MLYTRLFRNKLKPIRPKRIDNALYAGVKVLRGNQISFSDKRSRRWFEPNVQKTFLYSEILDERVKVKATTKALRWIDKCGGLDNYLLQTPEHKVDSTFGRILKKKLIEKLKENVEKEAYRQKVEYHARLLLPYLKENKELLQYSAPATEEQLKEEALMRRLEGERQRSIYVREKHLNQRPKRKSKLKMYNRQKAYTMYHEGIEFQKIPELPPKLRKEHPDFVMEAPIIG